MILTMNIEDLSNFGFSQKENKKKKQMYEFYG